MNHILKDGEVIKTTAKEDIIDAVKDKQTADISKAKAIIKINLKNVVGVGGHNKEIISEVENELEKISKAEDILKAIEKYDF
jgi:hypothetical protein